MLSQLWPGRSSVLLIWSTIILGSAALYFFYGVRAGVVLLALLLIYLAVKLGAGTLANFSARTRLSLRWKISGIIVLMLGVLLAVALAGLASIRYTQNEIQSIQQFRAVAPQPQIARVFQEAQGPQGELIRQMQARNTEISASLDSLENTQHRILIWTPWIIFGGTLIAIGLGAALSSSLIRPLEKMSAATRRIAGGDFSRPVDVPNRDEVGDLAQSLNNAAQDLGRFQAALLAEERARSLQERIAQTSLAQEEERRRISRELHDGLGPSLADMTNRLSVCRQLVRADPQKAEAGLDEATALLRGHIKEIRELINDLRPLAVDQLGLVEAVRQYVERFGEESGIKASLTVDGSLSADPLIEVTIYRVVQESLTNVRRHAQATEVEVSLRRSEDDLEATVSDNGRGVASAKGTTSAVKGVGLTSMRERSELVGGSFTVHSGPGQGCQTILRIPVRR